MRIDSYREEYVPTGPAPPPAHAKGGFKPNGQWDFEGSWSNPVSVFVKGLIKIRRERPISPDAMACLIQNSSFADAFGNISKWQWLTEPEDWMFAHCSTSAAQALKVCGWGGLPGRWDDVMPGRWIPVKPGDVERPAEPAATYTEPGGEELATP